MSAGVQIQWSALTKGLGAAQSRGIWRKPARQTVGVGFTEESTGDRLGGQLASYLAVGVTGRRTNGNHAGEDGKENGKLHDEG